MDDLLNYNLSPGVGALSTWKDSVLPVMAAVHSGWKGTVRRISHSF